MAVHPHAPGKIDSCRIIIISLHLMSSLTRAADTLTRATDTLIEHAAARDLDFATAWGISQGQTIKFGDPLSRRLASGGDYVTIYDRRPSGPSGQYSHFRPGIRARAQLICSKTLLPSLEADQAELRPLCAKCTLCPDCWRAADDARDRTNTIPVALWRWGWDLSISHRSIGQDKIAAWLATNMPGANIGLDAGEVVLYNSYDERLLVAICYEVYGFDYVLASSCEGKHVMVGITRPTPCEVKI